LKILDPRHQQACWLDLPVFERNNTDIQYDIQKSQVIQMNRYSVYLIGGSEKNEEANRLNVQVNLESGEVI
jgi:hypothetical protein